MQGGWMSLQDLELLDHGLALSMGLTGGPVTVVEVGVGAGGTARGIREAFRLAERGLDYCGVDLLLHPDSVRLPYDGAKMVWGDSLSALTIDSVPRPIHLLIVDGCHCYMHALGDVSSYGKLVAPGGLMFVHDTRESDQRERGIGARVYCNYDACEVNAALADSGILGSGWKVEGRSDCAVLYKKPVSDG